MSPSADEHSPRQDRRSTRRRERVWETVMDPNRLKDWVTIHRSVRNVSDKPMSKGSTMEQVLHMRGVSFHVHWTLSDVERAAPRRVGGPRPRPLAARASGMSFPATATVPRCSNTSTSSRSRADAWERRQPGDRRRRFRARSKEFTGAFEGTARTRLSQTLATRREAVPSHYLYRWESEFVHSLPKGRARWPILSTLP